MTDETRRRGLEMMAKAYGWEEVADGPGDFFGYTVDHLFAEIWTRDGLSLRDRRLLILGLVVGFGLDDVIGLQMQAALTNDELTPDELREIVSLLTHYAGWPKGAKLNTQAEEAIARDTRRRRPAEGSPPPGDGSADH
jgi:4-carboxymuconolactone decarboxylase